MATHQGQSKPKLVVPTEGGHRATDLRRIEVIQTAKLLKDFHQRQKRLPMAVGTVMKQSLTLFDLMFQLLHPTAMLLELLAVTPAMGGMLLLLIFEITHRVSLSQHLSGQVVLRRGHVVTTGHMSHRKSKTATGLIAMTQLTGPTQVRCCHATDLQAAQFNVDAHHRLTGQEHPEVVVREAKQQGELTRAIHLVDNHRRRDPTSQLG